MLNAIRQFLRAKPARPPASVPAGQRIYAIGDIHGRLDLFDALADAIERDDAAQGRAETTVVLLGDLIDRGPDSAGVVARAREWSQRRRVRIIAGNHEEMLLQSLDHLETFRAFLRYGGRETILSYPVDARAFHMAELAEAQAMMRRAIPVADLDFIRRFEDHVVFGDYLFVHAGVQPGAPIDQQKRHDLRWIREPFLSHAGDFGHVVVHGHTIAAEPVLRANRIGIDTGAFMSGKLTALALEGESLRLIEARESEGAISVTTRAPD